MALLIAAAGALLGLALSERLLRTKESDTHFRRPAPAPRPHRPDPAGSAPGARGAHSPVSAQRMLSRQPHRALRWPRGLFGVRTEAQPSEVGETSTERNRAISVRNTAVLMTTPVMVPPTPVPRTRRVPSVKSPYPTTVEKTTTVYPPPNGSSPVLRWRKSDVVRLVNAMDAAQATAAPRPEARDEHQVQADIERQGACVHCQVLPAASTDEQRDGVVPGAGVEKHGEAQDLERNDPAAGPCPKMCIMVGARR